jgi:hypothetical protein
VNSIFTYINTPTDDDTSTTAAILMEECQQLLLVEAELQQSIRLVIFKLKISYCYVTAKLMCCRKVSIKQIFFGPE